MRRLVPLQIRAWMLPLIVAALVLPIVAGFAIAGPPLGLALGAVAVAALLVIAARAQFDEPIEVAPSADRRYRVLLVAGEAVTDPDLVHRVVAIAAEGAGALDARERPLVYVLVPARMRALDRWASDLGEARDRAAGLLAASFATFDAAGIEVAGGVGDADPVQAIGDLLAGFPAREVLIVPGPGIGAAQADEVRRRLDRPVRLLAGGPGTGVHG